jgi:hypothetical protein
MLHAITRRLVALLIVCSALLLPDAPLLQAATSTEDMCPCCKRGGISGGASSCSRRHHTGSGPAFSSAPECCQQCPQAPSVSPLAATVACGQPASFPLPAASQAQVRQGVLTCSPPISFSLSQRPPPAWQI